MDEAQEVQENSPAILKIEQSQASPPATPRLSLQLGADGQDTGTSSAPAQPELELDQEAWELLSRSQCGSHCGSSPRALSHAEAEEAAVEEEAEAQRRGRAATVLLLTPPAPGAAAAAPEPSEAQPGPPSPPQAGSDTPRSAASAASVADDGHEVYSMSQDGSVDALSETYTDDLMTLAEPDLPPSPRSAPNARAPAPPRPRLCNLGEGLGLELAALAERVRACVVSARPSVTAAAVLVWRSVAQWAGRLHLRIAALAADAPQRLAGLRAALPLRLPAVPESLQPQVAAGAEAAKLLAGSARQAATAAGAQALALGRVARKQLAHAKWDWAHMALAASCLSVAALLAHSWHANARLAARLAEREELLADLLIRIVKLRSNMTNRAVPIIRHTSTPACSLSAQAAGACMPAYPALPLAISAA